MSVDRKKPCFPSTSTGCTQKKVFEPIPKAQCVSKGILQQSIKKTQRFKNNKKVFSLRYWELSFGTISWLWTIDLKSHLWMWLTHWGYQLFGIKFLPYFSVGMNLKETLLTNELIDRTVAFVFQSTYRNIKSRSDIIIVWSIELALLTWVSELDYQNGHKKSGVPLNPVMGQWRQDSFWSLLARYQVSEQLTQSHKTTWPLRNDIQGCSLASISIHHAYTKREGYPEERSQRREPASL